MAIKPKYLYLYISDIAISDIVEHSPFRYDNLINQRISKDQARFEYEHYTLECYRMTRSFESMRGIRCWQILVEDELYDKLTEEQINCILKPIMAPYSLLGGKIVKVDKYNY